MDVRTLCLGVLTLGDMTGYEIKKHFEEAFSHFFPASYGSIYPALGDLARDGLVTVTDVAQNKRPDKKVYAVTAAGRERLAEAIEAAPPRHRVRSEFLVQLYFAHLLPVAEMAGKLDRRIADIEETLGTVECFAASDHPSPAREMVAGLGRVTLEAQLRYLREHRDAFLAALGADTAARRATGTHGRTDVSG